MVLGLLLFSSCKDDVFPKPASHLRLDYPIAKYVDFEDDCPFSFEMNSSAIIEGLWFYHFLPKDESDDLPDL
jgi:hypothetical protein